MEFAPLFYELVGANRMTADDATHFPAFIKDAGRGKEYTRGNSPRALAEDSAA